MASAAAHRRRGGYGTPSIDGRSHATKHHYVAERFFGRSGNRPGDTRERIFDVCPWNCEGQSEVYCYECHEILLHNPVLLPADIAAFRELVARRRLDETDKPPDQAKLGGRIRLLHEVIATGLDVLRAKGRA